MAPRPSVVTLSSAVLLGFGRPPGGPAGHPLRVLVAEPDPGRRAMLRAALEQAGDAAICVGGWGEALGTLSRQPVDAAVLALSLPGAGGLDAARSLRAWPAPVSALPLLALHAGHTRMQERDWRDAGFDALLAWPGDLGDLAARIRAVVEDLIPPEPLDPAIRAALLAEHGQEALAARDIAALRAAAEGMAALRAAPDAAAAAVAAEAIAAACDRIGAPVAAAAARVAGRDFPRGQEALVGALAATGGAIRFAGRAGRQGAIA